MLGQDKTLPEAIEAGKTTRRPERLSVNGCLILKSMLSMPQSACRGVTDAIVARDSAAVEFIASDPSGARVLETLLKVRFVPITRVLLNVLGKVIVVVLWCHSNECACCESMLQAR